MDQLIEGKYRYFAFISYKREDERWAKWLQHKLEHYKLPSNLNGRTDLPHSIRPVFKDTSELTPGNLPEQINEALQQSKYLIVICSPRSAQSEWVNKEVETFIFMGKTDSIIPFIIDGKPFSSNHEEECFPQAILSLPREQEILGANINEMGRDVAAVKVVARMFDIHFDELWQRHERELRRRRIIIVASIAAFALAVLGVAGWIWHQNIELSEKNLLINRQNRALDAKTDSLRSANDSIQAQQNSLRVAYNDLAKSRQELALTNDNLIVANQQIALERDNVLKANWEIKRNLNRFIAGKVQDLINDGEYQLAQLVALQILPDNEEDHNIPYVAEAEAAFRKALQMGTVLKGHSLLVYSAEFSRDGKYIVSASNDGDMRLWDVKSESCIRKFKHSGRVHYATFSPDGNRILSISDGKVRIWDVKTGNVKIEFDGFRSASFSPNGKIIATSTRDKVNIHNAFTGRRIASLTGHSNSVSSIRFSPDGQVLATSSDDETIRIWDVKTWKCINVLEGHKDFVNSVSFSPDGDNLVSASSDNTIKIWNLKNGELLNSFMLPGEASCASYSPDGNSIVGSYGKDIVMIDANTGFRIRTFIGHTHSVFDVSFNPDGTKIASASFDRTIRVWNIGKPLSVGNQIYTFSPNGKHIASISSDKHSVIIFDVKTGNVLKTMSGHTDDIVSISYNENGCRLFSLCAKGEFRVWDLATGRFTQRLLPTDFKLNDYEINKSGTHILSTKGGAYWDVSKKKWVGMVVFWDILNEKWIRLFGHTKNATSAQCSSDNNKIVSTSQDSTIRIWNSCSGACIKILRAEGSIPRCASFGPDGKKIVSADENVIRIWDAYSGECIKKWKVSDSALENGNIPSTMIESVAFSNDGQRIISSHMNGEYIIWNVEDGLCMHRIQTGYTPLRNATFSPDGKNIAYSTTSGPIKVDKYPSLQELVDSTSKRLSVHKLTSEERRVFFLE